MSYKLKTTLFLILAVLFCFQSSAELVNDSFEDQELEKWYDDRTETKITVDETNFVFSNSQAFSESISLAHEDTGNHGDTIYSKNHSLGNKVYYAYHYFEDKSINDHGARLQVDSPQDGRGAMIQVMSVWDKWRFRTDDSGCCIDGGSPETNKWYEYRIELRPSSNEVDFRIKDMADNGIEFQDTLTQDWQASKVAAKISLSSEGTGSWEYFDNVTREDAESSKLAATDGFESGSYSDGSPVEWKKGVRGSGSTNAIRDVKTDRPYRGSYSLFMDQDGNGDNPSTYTTYEKFSPSNVTAAMYHKDTGFYADSHTNWELGSSSVMSTQVDPTNAGITVNGQTVNSGASTGSWYEFRLNKIDWVNNEVGEVKVYKDGTKLGELSNVAFNTNANSINRTVYYFGDDGGSSGYLDDVTVNSGKQNNQPIADVQSPDGTNLDPNSVELEAKALEPEDENMNITFYNATDHTKIEKKENVNNGTYTTTWTGLSEDQTYNWYANVTDGTNTVQSNPATFTTIDITLNWNDQSNNENGFKIYSNASGTLKQIKKVGKDTESTTAYNTGLEFNKNTTYEVAAYNQYGESNRIKGFISP